MDSDRPAFEVGQIWRNALGIRIRIEEVGDEEVVYRFADERVPPNAFTRKISNTHCWTFDPKENQ